ncbi:MAG: MFS transporter [Planctomycetota bacterium]|nr:MFS transporter [Planctomycetota bacterium]
MSTHRPGPLAPILVLSFLATFGTAVLWNGLPFIAREAYGFDERWNLALAVWNGLVYAATAFGSGRVLRRLQHRLDPRTVVAWVFILQIVLCPLVLLSDSTPVLFLVSGGMSALAAFFWPIVEAYVAAGRSPEAMRHAIGWWNATWMTALGLALVAIAPFLALGHAAWAIGGLAPINLVCLAVLLVGMPRRPPNAVDDDSRAPAPSHYPALLASHRAMLPLAYALIGALSPLMPYLLADLEASLAWQTPLTATWMFTRVIGIAWLRTISWWHGRWATAIVGAGLLLGGFLGVLVAPTIALITLALAVFGLGQAVIYYGALYYVMRVGHAEVEAASTHEGLIGVGYAAGPAAAAVGVVAGGGPLLVASSLLLPAVAAWPAIRPWWRTRGG